LFYLVEQFLSIQGEGRYAGSPSYFLRTGGCNLSCAGFGTEYRVGALNRLGCDTYFAVDRDFSGGWLRVTDANSLISNMESRFERLGYIPDVVITGGEPLLYHSDEVFYRVIELLVERGISITFETNGTIEIDFDRYPAYRDAIFALSIKLSNSGEPFRKRVNLKAIERIVSSAKESFFKFTIPKELVDTTALEEIETVTYGYENQQIYCMPLGESRIAIEHNDKNLFNFCIENGFNYSDRLHIRIFDTTQGV